MTHILNFSSLRTFVDIHLTVMDRKRIARYLPAGHVIVGCEPFHIYLELRGQKILHYTLLEAVEVDLITEPTAFIAACYRSKVKGDINTHYQF